MGTQQFCLRWNNHQTNMLSVFDQLLKTGEFVDVTLACEGLSIKAHKVVLSACSPYFQNLLRENPCKHPIVILKDMRYVELRTIIDFMYKGEINVSQEQLTSLLKTAETLKVKGLAEVSSGIFTNLQGDSTTSITEDLNSPASQQEDVKSPQTHHDGRVSPYSKRKRHRPSRRLSSDANTESPTLVPEPSYENTVDSRTASETISNVAVPSDGSESLITPKEEPMELPTEPSVDLGMESGSPYQHLDLPLLGRSKSTDSRESGFVCNEDGLTVAHAQPSTSGAHMVGQDSGRSRRWKPADMWLAIEAVRAGFGIKSASKQYGIPTMTLWRWTQKCGITSVFSTSSGGRKTRCVGSSAAVRPGIRTIATTSPPAQYSCVSRRGRRRPSPKCAVIPKTSLHVDNGTSSSCASSSPFIPWVRTPYRSGPCKTWQEDTMFSAVRAVLKLGMPLINVSRRFGIPYPTLFYYTNRVRQLLKPYEREDVTVSHLRQGGISTRGFTRSPGKRGRPTKVYLGTWKDEDLTQAILRVVYKDFAPEALEALVRSVGNAEETVGSWPSSDVLPDCEIIPVESQIQELGENAEDDEEREEENVVAGTVSAAHESLPDIKEIIHDYRDDECSDRVESPETGCSIVHQMEESCKSASVS